MFLLSRSPQNRILYDLLIEIIFLERRKRLMTDTTISGAKA